MAIDFLLTESLPRSGGAVLGHLRACWPSIPRPVAASCGPVTVGFAPRQEYLIEKRLVLGSCIRQWMVPKFERISSPYQPLKCPVKFALDLHPRFAK